MKEYKLTEDQKDYPAFPYQYSTAFEEDYIITRHGMTLRDYFAAKVIQSIIAKEGASHPENDLNYDCERAYFYADAMLKQRDI